MGDVKAFLDLLQAGGNAAMIGLFFLMWKFDRRLIKIETTMAGHLRDEKYIHRIVDRVLTRTLKPKENVVPFRRKTKRT